MTRPVNQSLSNFEQRSQPALTFSGDLIRLQNKMNLELALSQPSQISSMRNDTPEMLELIIALLLRGLDASLNATHKMNEDQLEECCLMIIEKYWMLRPEEIMLVFKNAKMGKYGSDYNRIDMATIFRWIDTYLELERYPHFENKPKIEPDLISMEEFNEKYEAQKIKTAETGTNDMLDFSKQLAESRKSANKEEHFKKLYQAEYLKQSKGEDFTLTEFDKQMGILKKKMGL